MRLFKGIILHFFLVISLWTSNSKVLAQELNLPQENKKINLYFFWGNGCPHCAREERFLNKLQEENPNVVVYKFEVWENATNRELLKKVGQLLSADVRGVPFTLIGKYFINGYHDDSTTGEQIKRYINYCLNNNCPDVIELINDLSNPTDKQEDKNPTPPQVPPEQQNPPSKPEDGKNNSDSQNNNQNHTIPNEVVLPIIGKVNLLNLSLPLVATILGTLDGFNPCAMWILLFLISLLINIPSKTRRWILGVSFLLASGFSYFLFMAAWLNILLFVGFIHWVRIAIATFAIIAGSLSLNKFLTHKTGCEVTSDERRKEIFNKLKTYAYDKRLIAALFGIISLAFAVNLVELMCSAGFPAVFTQILALNNLPTLQYYTYIGVYILFFMLDDMLVFFIAMRTLELTGFSTKYSKYSNLLGGILMLAIGTLLIVKPEFLTFSF